MKITRKGSTIIDTEESKTHLTFADLQKGDVFRYRRGHDDAIYIMGEDGSVFALGTQIKHAKSSYNSEVILYPNAVLELGEEQTQRIATTTLQIGA